jgi:hypothetical protein
LKILREVWAGRACAGANQQELTSCKNTWAGRKRFFLQGGSLGHPRKRDGDCSPQSDYTSSVFQSFDFLYLYFSVL